MSIPNFIEVYPVFDKEYCDYSIKSFEEANEHGLCGTRKERENVNSMLIDDKSVNFPVYDFPLAHVSAPLVEQFDEGLNKGLLDYYAKYATLQQVGELRYYEAKLQKTLAGQGYHTWHCEAGARNYALRILTWTVYLNDNFDAGETEFLYQQYRYKPKMGDLVIFPAGFTHTHRGNPPINGEKYIITGWLEF